MTKAWDFEVLKASLAAEGMPMVEGVAEKVAGVVFAWAGESLKLEGGLIEAVGAPALAAVSKVALQAIDKIDGKEG